jgi:prevent-host-death family protein
METAKHPLDQVQPLSPWFGTIGELGKTEARQSFLQLLNELTKKPASVAVTDRGKRVAVIMAYQQYEALLNKAAQSQQKTNQSPLVGLITDVEDFKTGQAEVDKVFKQSLKRK